MGFFLQLRILLWKNIIHKMRSPGVLMFELFIPLVLFIILLLIRKKQPPHPRSVRHFSAQPLPSAGVVSIMQQFCNGGKRDEQGFMDHPKNKAYEFLEQFKSVAQHNNFFDPGFSIQEMDHIPELYRSIIEDPAALHQHIKHAKDFQLSSLFRNVTVLQHILVQNLSIPLDHLQVLARSNVNIKEVYRLLFGADIDTHLDRVSRFRRSLPLLSKDDSAARPTLLQQLTGLSHSPQAASDFLPHLDSGLMYKLLRDDPTLLMDPEVQDVMGQLLGLRGDQTKLDPKEVADVVKKVILAPGMLHDITCDVQVLPHVFIPQNKEDTETLMETQWMLCNLTNKQWTLLSQALSSNINTDELVQQLNLEDMNISATRYKVKEFSQNLQQFILFEKNLMMLSSLASNLPQDACMENPDHPNSTTIATDTANSTHADSVTLNPPQTGDPHTKTKKKNGHSKDEGQSRRKPKTKKKHQYDGLLEIWLAMQTTICGQPAISKWRLEKFSKSNRLDDLGVSGKMKYDLGILVHVLYSNPKVLYSPKDTEADKVIQRANETFALVDKISLYARKWLNISAEIRDYLTKNTTEMNLGEIRQMQAELKSIPGMDAILFDSPDIQQFVTNATVPDVDFFLAQLDIVDNAACSWLALLDGISLNIFKGFNNERELEYYAMHYAYADNVTVLASVVFTNMHEDGSLPPHIVYKIRQNATFTQDTRQVRPPYWYPGPVDWAYYYYQFGFVWVQDVMERAMIDTFTGREVVEPGSYIHQFPYPCYVKDTFLFMIEHVMPLCLTISWVYTVAMLVQSIVHEKEQRLKEVMKMMGLTNSVHWLAWFITTFTQMSISMAILTTMLKVGHVLAWSNPFLIFLVLEVFAIATISFSFLVSVLYSKAKVAAACAGILYFLSYVPYMYVAIREEAAHDKIPAWAKSIASLFSTTAFGLGAKYFAFYEIESVGVQWSNLSISPVENDQYNLFTVIMMMIFDAMLYGILTWYIENVHPGSYGLPKPWYFPFTRSYWFGHPRTESEQCSWRHCFGHHDVSIMEEDQACAMAQQQGSDLNFEAEPSHLPMGVCIDNLTKVYKTGKLAVNKLSLNLYEDQITSFLGHNGAGKTTTMSILTGMFPPTGGYATIYNHDIRTDMEEIRKSLGMCPQHNVLFDKLTVEEHLWFYAKLKGMSSKDIKEEMETMIQDIELPKKRHNKVDCLSGGMKRKLSVAIAFVAGSRTVILDEPTAGVDPYARRAIWDLLIKYKKGRTILLSTHHMDEADILGDRIAIISHGQLKCAGSSLFLKSTFGEGYHLTLVKKSSEPDVQSSDTCTLSQEDELTSSHSSFHTKCTEASVTEFITRYVSTAYIKSETVQQIQYILPFDEARKGCFEKLFVALDRNLAQLHISSYGVMDTTLEEVFLKVTEKAQNDKDEEESIEKGGDKLKQNLTQEVGGQVEGEQVKDDRSDCTSETSLLLPDLGPEVEMGALGESQRSAEETGKDQRSMSRSSSHSDVSLLDVAPASAQRNRDYTRLSTEDDPLIDIDEDKPSILLEGSGSSVVHGYWLLLQQFYAIIEKRHKYVRRNWKGLFSQILLPALFVCVAMTVALTAPQVEDLPPIVISPAQYYNYTQPRGNYIPYTNVNRQKPEVPAWSKDASPSQLIATFRLPSGVAATCVLKTPFNSSFDEAILRNINFTHRNFKLLEKYFDPMCESVFQKGILLENYLPPVPTATPSSEAKEVNLTHLGMLNLVTSNPIKGKYYPDCHCAPDGTTYVCSKSGFDFPPHYQVVTSDILQDLTGEKEEQYYLHTTDMYRLHRYGAFSFGHERKYVPEEFNREAPAIFGKLAVRRIAKVWYNHKGYHAMPIYLNAINNAILRANLPKKRGNPAAYGITLLNHPMNNTDQMKTLDYIMQGSDVLIAIFIIVAMSFVPASFVLFLVYERFIKAKHLQFVSGINRVVYWIANYVWDMCNYLVPALCCIIILRGFNIPAYVSATNFPAVIALFLMYGWSITPMMYPASFVFNEPSTAYVFLIVINLFIGITCIITSFLLEIFQRNDSYRRLYGQNYEDLAKAHEILKNVFLVFPNYCLGRGLMDVAFNQYKNDYYFKTGQYDKMRSPFEWDIVARNLAAMAAMGISFFLITLMCEFNFFRKPKRIALNPLMTPPNEDVDVAAERKRTLRGSGRRDVVRMENLTKIYKTRKLGRHLAVDRLCLGIPQGECFGLLGVNGAGKTTTFKMLTGDLPPTGGDAFLNGNSILRDLSGVQRNMGYCPQFDALYDELTAREHLQLYARLRGVPPKDQKQVVDWALEKLALMQFADKQSGTYSGGNKRKLSTAIALIGQPPVIFLDEPTTGMDPSSRRFLWDLILSLIRDGRSVLLTSHSMEECEALCTRLAIMVNGRFKCIGSSQHLKNRFGEGYSIMIRVTGPDYDHQVESVKRFMLRNFPQAMLKEHHHNMVQYELGSAGLSLARLFSHMEEAQQDLQVEDYSICQNTLDNVFINFVKQQVEILREPEDGSLSVTSGGVTELQSLSQDESLDTAEEEDLPAQLEQSGTQLTFLEMDISDC